MIHSPLLQLRDTFERVISATDARQTKSDQWLGHCPAHGSKRHRDLSIRLTNDRILLFCFGACETERVCHLLELTLADLFLEPRQASHDPKPMVQPNRIDRAKLSFQLELAALDRRLRADVVLKAVAVFNGDTVSDEGRDRLIKVVARAYADRDRAAYLETVADDFRMKAFHERTAPHAA